MHQTQKLLSMFIVSVFKFVGLPIHPSSMFGGWESKREESKGKSDQNKL